MNLSSAAGPRALLYVVDDYHSVSQTFVRREIDMLRDCGVTVMVFSLHPTGHAIEGLELPPASLGRLLRVAAALPLTSPGRRVSRDLALLVVRFPGRRFRQLFALLVAGHIRRNLSDTQYHIHAHFVGRCADVAYYLSRFTGFRYTLTGHAADVLAPKDSGVFRRNVVSASGLVGQSNLIRTRFLALLGDPPPAPIMTIRSGLPRSTIDQAVPRPMLPGAGEPVSLLTVARLVPKKGFVAVLAAARALQDLQIAFRWRIIGDGPLRAWLETSIAALPDPSAVELLGARTNAATLALVREAHVFVLPCITLDGDTDGLPAALIEAVALGTPVVTTAVGAIPELVCNGETGLIVPEGDGSAVADAIQRLLADPRLYHYISDASRTLGREAYVLESEVDRLRAFFRDVGIVGA